MTVEDTVERIAHAESWDERVSRIRQIPQRHGTDAHPAIYAQIAQRVYVPHLSPDFAYIHEADFYDAPYFDRAYERARAGTNGFMNVDPATLAAVLEYEPLPFSSSARSLGSHGGSSPLRPASLRRRWDRLVSPRGRSTAWREPDLT